MFCKLYLAIEKFLFKQNFMVNENYKNHNILLVFLGTWKLLIHYCNLDETLA